MRYRGVVQYSVFAFLVGFALSDASAGSLTIGKTWSSGETLTAAELNQNFASTKAAVDDNDARTAANTADITSNATNIATNAASISALQLGQAAASSGTIGAGAVNFSSTITNVRALTVSAPAAGIMIFTVTGSMSLRSHTTGSQSEAQCSLSDANNSLSVNRAVVHIPDAIPTFSTTAGWLTPFSLSVPVSVSAAGNVSRFLNCQKTTGGGASDGFVQFFHLYATFVPKTL